MDQYLIYLRKSRKDRELELLTGNFDTLERHRTQLLQLARERGYAIAGILEEVVSGETIAERPRMQELLALVESGEYTGVLVTEVPRLARGNTRDQGIVSETFQYSGTKIITPEKIYDPSDEADEEYFEFGLFMSRREYKMINKRLNRGRMASLQEGKYIAGTAPYGYEKYKIPKQKGYSLRIIEDRAEVVRRIYHMYTVGLPGTDGHDKPMGSHRIAKQLNAEGVLSPGGASWTATAVRDILKNPVYTGMLRWAYRPVKKRVVDGEVRYTTPIGEDPKIVRGMHEPIIEAAIWQRAQEIMKNSKHSSVPSQKKMLNPLAGVLYCSECGRSMVRMRAGQNRPTYRLVCPTADCPTVSHRIDEVEEALLDSIGCWLADHKLQDELNEVSVDETGSRQAAATVKRLRRNIETLKEQQSRLYDLLEQGVYSSEVFLERSKVLAGKIAEAQRAAEEAEAAAKKKEEADKLRRNVIPRMEHALQTYRTLSTAEERSLVLKKALSKVLYQKKGPAEGPRDFVLYIFPRLE